MKLDELRALFSEAENSELETATPAETTSTKATSEAKPRMVIFKCRFCGYEHHVDEPKANEYTSIVLRHKCDPFGPDTPPEHVK